jgi:hypothetical protein
LVILRTNLLGFFNLKVTGYLKTFIKIMVSLKFHDKLEEKDFITVNANKDENDIVLTMYDIDTKRNYYLYLDKSTAIKFSKELRKQIALLY